MRGDRSRVLEGQLAQEPRRTPFARPGADGQAHPRSDGDLVEAQRLRQLDALNVRELHETPEQLPALAPRHADRAELPQMRDPRKGAAVIQSSRLVADQHDAAGRDQDRLAQVHAIVPTPQRTGDHVSGRSRDVRHVDPEDPRLGVLPPEDGPVLLVGRRLDASPAGGADEGDERVQGPGRQNVPARPRCIGEVGGRRAVRAGRALQKTEDAPIGGVGQDLRPLPVDARGLGARPASVLPALAIHRGEDHPARRRASRAVDHVQDLAAGRPRSPRDVRGRLHRRVDAAEALSPRHRGSRQASAWRRRKRECVDGVVPFGLVVVPGFVGFHGNIPADPAAHVFPAASSSHGLSLRHSSLCVVKTSSPSMSTSFTATVRGPGSTGSSYRPETRSDFRSGTSESATRKTLPS